MTDQDHQPQRTATRAPVGKAVRLQFDDSTDVVEGVCDNVSIGGMYVAVDDARPEGSLVRFELVLNERQSVRGLGEVIWMRPRSSTATVTGGMGIKFRFLEQRDRQLIFKLVSQHIKDRLASEVRPPESEPASEEAPALEPPPPLVRLAAEDVRADGEDETAEAPWSDDAAALSDPSAAPAARDGHDQPGVDDAVAPSPARHEPMVTAPASVLGAEAAARPGGFFDAAESAAESADGAQGGGGFHADHEDRTAPELGAAEPAALPRRRRRRRGLAGGRRAPALLMLAVAVLGAGLAIYLFRDRLFSSLNRVPDDVVDIAPAAGEEAPPAELSTLTPIPPPPAASLPAVPPPPAAEPPPPPAATAAALTRVVDIGWRVRDDGGLNVLIVTDGPVTEDRVRHFRLDGDPPREVIQLRGVRERFPRARVPVSEGPLAAIRTGYHQKASGNELHIVFDLSDPTARVTSIVARGQQLEIEIRRP